MHFPFKVWRQFCVPQHALTCFAGWLSHAKLPWLKNFLIRWFIKRYQVSLEEAQETDIHSYPAFHDFFIRQLKPALRPVDSTPQGISSPCDGTISQIGKIEQGTLLQAKGRHFSVSSLLGNEEDAKIFANGHFITIYLAPKDYHRVHMPYHGNLNKLRYIPGKLFSVNPLTTQYIDHLFARNERVITFFEHDHKSFAIILVGAMIVGSIYTRWGGNIIPHCGNKIMQISYPQTPSQQIKLDKGDEMGYFSLGSTVIVLLAENLSWEYDVNQNSRLVVGQKIGHFLP